MDVAFHPFGPVAAAGLVDGEGGPARIRMRREAPVGFGAGRSGVEGEDATRLVGGVCVA